MKRRGMRIAVGALLYVIAIALQLENEWIELGLFLASFLIVGGDVVLRAGRNILHGNVFDENFLMSLATIGAFFIGEFPEGVAVMLFYQVGELFQDYAVNQSRKSISGLMDIRPDYANLKRGNEITTVDPEDVKVDDVIVIKPGERIPLDAIILEGNSTLDTSALTGESLPREVESGSEVLSGCINISGVLTARVMKEYGESTVSKILDLVENASNKKSKSEQFITKFARYYTPVVVIIAVFLAFLPPLLIQGEALAKWVYRALSFLVVSCPCALVISIPLSFFGGIGGASKRGILVKGSNYLEALARTETVVFDKTGTLTKGVFHVTKIHAVGISEEVLLEKTAYAESFSNHPISQSLKARYQKEILTERIQNVTEIPGRGVKAYVDKDEVLVGNGKLMREEGIAYVSTVDAGTVVHVVINKIYAGYILISDEIKEDAVKAIQELMKANIHKTAMLTGDSMAAAENVAKELGIQEVYAELLPIGKVEQLERLLSEKSENGKLCFVGDGINDAPVLARADIGIAMGGLGSDAAIEAADIVIMTDEPSKIATAIKISKKTLRIANQNIVFAIGIKVAILALSALGYASMWAAVFADVGVAMLAILNSFRALQVKNL